MRALAYVIGLTLLALAVLGSYRFVETRRELTDLSPVIRNGGKTVLIGDGRASLRYPALLYLSCVNGQPSRLIASWRMAQFNEEDQPAGSYQGWVGLLAFQRKPWKSVQYDIKRGYDLATGRYRQLVVTPPLSPEEIDGVSETLTQHADWQHAFHATERGFYFNVADKARAGLRDACSQAG